MATAQPIFIHSLFRSASTYFFHEFRGIETFCCYEEPFNESLAALNHSWRHYRLLESPNAPGLRHPRLDRPYFYEYWQAREHLQGLFRASFAYDHYFARDGELPAPQKAWLSAIIAHAPARPVLQFCRSSGRVAALRSLFGGKHLHLWREPRVQWWSYKTADYFDSVSRRIYRSAHLPEALRALRRMAHLPRSRYRHPQPRGNYLSFYGLWLDAWLRLSAHSDLSINVDRIAVFPAENSECARRLSELVGCSIDLAGIRTSGMVFAAAEEPFYAEVEGTVHELFARTGHATGAALQAASAAAAQARDAHNHLAHDVTTEQNLRLAAMSLMRCLAGGGRPGGSRWPQRWYPKRFHDYVRWALQRLQRRPHPGAQPVDHPAAPHADSGAGGVQTPPATGPKLG